MSTAVADKAGGVKAWLTAHPVAGFTVLAFGISYLLGVPLLAFASGAIPPDRIVLRTYLPRVLIVFGPGLAAMAMASLAGSGARALLSKLIPTRGDVLLAVVVVAVGTATASAALLVAGVGASELWTTVRGNMALLVAHVILQLIVIATGEELGWRGWLLPVLAARTTRLRATLLTAVVWAVWHGPRLLESPRVAATFTVSVAGLSVLFTWLWSRAGHRMFPVIVAHAMVNAPVFFWEQASVRDDLLAGTWMTIHTVYTAIAVAFVLVGWRWWTAREREDLSWRVQAC